MGILNTANNNDQEIPARYSKQCLLSHVNYRLGVQSGIQLMSLSESGTDIMYV